MKILVTGGAGFIGSHVATALSEAVPKSRVTALDNLRRRGSDLALPRLRAAGVAFQHGDVRVPEDLAAAGAADLLVDCAGEPGVHAGYNESPSNVVSSNLVGVINCLEHVRRHGGDFVYVSTGRVYPIAALRDLPLSRVGERFVIALGARGTGWSEAGISEDFPLKGSRSLQGATRLAAELLIAEYRALYGLRAVINRCGTIAGPGQMGRAEHGFVAHWLAQHVYGGSLAFSGFGGKGAQVRDVLHVADLCDLVVSQCADMAAQDGNCLNVGGGAGRSVSLLELTRACRTLAGTSIPVAALPETRPADIPYYVSDCSAVHRRTLWRPKRELSDILSDMHRWLVDNRALLAPMALA
jgi:CDP-paratose 2-epimerase